MSNDGKIAFVLNSSDDNFNCKIANDTISNISVDGAYIVDSNLLTADKISNNYSNSTYSISVNDASTYSSTTLNSPYNTISTTSLGYSNIADSWVSITDNYFKNDEAKTQFNVLENYFKMNLIKTNKYDRELTKNEFLDLVTLYINQITKKDCKINFTKNMLLEELTFKLDNSTIFTLNNESDLYPETYIMFRDIFYINTENFLAVLKRAAFNRLLNV